jgi:hypothetical protein
MPDELGRQFERLTSSPRLNVLERTRLAQTFLGRLNRSAPAKSEETS